MSEAMIYGCRQSRPTGQLLAKLLGWDYAEGNATSEIRKYEIVFRYGNTNDIYPDLGWHGFTINNLAAIKRASNKLECRRFLQGHEVHVPEVWDIYTMDDIKEYPVIARPFHHSQGRQFLIVDSPEKLAPILRRGYYAQKIIRKKDEYRLFVLQDKILEANQKVKVRADADPMIRNHRKGWAFKRMLVKDTPQFLKSNAVRATTSVGLSFCAVDCAITEDGLETHVFEVNSAPGLIPRKAQKFAARIHKWITEDCGLHICDMPNPQDSEELTDPSETTVIREPEPRVREARPLPPAAW